MVLLGGAIEGAAEEGVEAADVVHVQVGEAQVVDLLHRPEGQLPQAAVAAVKEQLADRLAAVHGHQQRVVAASSSEYLDRQSHAHLTERVIGAVSTP